MSQYVMLTIICAFVTSILLTQLTLFTNRYHGFLSYDHDLHSVQKVHHIPTSRIGGVSVFISFSGIILIDKLLTFGNTYGATIIISTWMVFIIGTLEDLTKVITPMMRMIVITLSALIAVYVTHALPIITHTDFDGFGQLIIHYPVVGIVLTLFCVVGLTNSYNIIDGFNGLTSTTAMINLLGIIIVASFIHDYSVIKATSILFAAILGFWLFNYPWGKIFLGDGGAYVIGFIIALISIYVPHQHKGDVSPYAFLLMSIYPITEIGFSMFRRKFLLHTKCMQPDAMHLHQLVYYRCVPHHLKNRNSYVMPLMLFFIIPPTFLAVVFYHNTGACLLLILLYIIFYVATYYSLIRFKTFGFLKILLK